MTEIIEVPTASFAIGQAPSSLVTVGVGSCVAICLYSPRHRAGALLHSMLGRAGQRVPNPALYADTGISAVLEQLIKLGVPPTSLTAKVIGGAEMFPVLQQYYLHAIGKRNIDEATRLLQAIGIPIAGTSTGGNRGRSLTFDLSSGLVTITEPFKTTPQII